ncbi:MAG: hypothetical protein QOG63_3093, partial [Thermoleophilaceae bacterium]|nr:hypothetical protein [Thermoleophilaceae bacterium]
MRTATLTLLVALLLAVPAQAQTTTTTPTAPAPTPLSTEPVPQNSAFEASGMWIWYVSHSSGGSVDAIARKAAKAGVTTVFVKSSDGAGVWSQFSSTLVAALHARGLKVCAWGYVYGSRPRAEARAARTAIA